MTKILNFALKIKVGGREGGTCEVLRPCHPPKIWNVHLLNKFKYVLQTSAWLRACSHEPGTVNYPGVMVAPGKALPRVHRMICCPGASSSSSDHYEFILIPLVFAQIVTENEF